MAPGALLTWCSVTVIGMPIFKTIADVVGRTVQLNKHPFTIVGVAPPDFRGTLVFGSPDFFVPIVNQEQVEGASGTGPSVLSSRVETIGFLWRWDT